MSMENDGITEKNFRMQWRNLSSPKCVFVFPILQTES